MPDCEAETRITQALYELELGWGAGVFDYAKIRRILTGQATEHCRTNHRQEAA